MQDSRVPNGTVVERSGDRPVPDVVVSDGIHVVRTGADGAFVLPDDTDAQHVWVSVPSAHRAFAPGWYADVRRHGMGPLRLVLEPRAEPVRDGCRFVQVTDLHVSVDGGARLAPMLRSGVVPPEGVQVTGETTSRELRDDLEAVVRSARPELIVATGDLADYGQPEELIAYREAITGIGVPVASVPGNHDQLSVLSAESIRAFFAGWSSHGAPEGTDVSATFQAEVFGGDWRRSDSGRTPWLDALGPLYYSFDWGGVHFVVYDGEGLRRYGDDYPQDRWLAADLGTIAADTPVVVLTHFPEERSFYRARFDGVRLVASFAGHWHATRAWDDGRVRHFTSGTLGFGGFDGTGRGYRIVDVDRDGARSRWVCLDTPDDPPSRVTGDAAVVDGRVVASCETADVRGSIVCVDGWTHDLPSPARGGVAAGDGLVFALDLGSRLHALDAATGGRRWLAQLGDDSARWVLGPPVVRDDVVYAGSGAGVHAFDARSGRELWRTPLATDWAASRGGVAVGDGLLAIGAVNDHMHLAVLDEATGAVRWRHEGRDISGVCATPAIVGDRILALHAHGWLRAYAADDGEQVWQSPLDDAWPIALAVVGGLAIVRSASGTVTGHRIDDGRQLWAQPLGPGPRAGRPYGRRPGGELAPLVVAGDQVWTARGEQLIALDLASGAIIGRSSADGEIAAIALDAAIPVAVTIHARAHRPG